MPADPKAAKAFLDSLHTSDRVRAAAWDALFSPDDTDAQSRLDAIKPLSNDMRTQLWDLRAGGTLDGTPQAPQTPSVEAFMDPRAPEPEGSAARRFVGSAASMLNPVAAVEGLYNAVRHPVNTAGAVWDAHAEQFGKAREAFNEGRYTEALGHGTATALPLIGPAAADVGEQFASGDVAGGFGSAAGLLVPVSAVSGVKAGVRGARAAMSPARREAVASSLEAGAADRVADVMSPKVGQNKQRFGHNAEGVAPRLAIDLAEEGAPMSRVGFHDQVATRLRQTEEALDAAHDARLNARTFETRPMVDALLEQRRKFTAEAVEGSRRYQAAGKGGALDEVPLGQDVVPGPNAARVAAIDQAIDELRRLGPVTRYDEIRKIRQAYDGPAKAIYSPSMTADYLKAQGGKLGAADVTGALRDQLGKWDPQTAAANADYHVYRTADDVLEATREVERTRPRVGRVIAARVLGTFGGAQMGGGAGALAGYVAAPLVDAGATIGLTTKLKVAALQQRLATAIRAGQVEQSVSIAEQLRRLAASNSVRAQAGVLANEAATTVAERRGPPAPATAQR